MCGIGGIVSRDPVELDALYPLMAAQAHRGPDGEGYLFDTPDGPRLNPPRADKRGGRWALGHKRLRILDISENGLQPMSSANGKLWVTFNGEIYNYKELKALLQTLGYTFKTRTDTEVILAAYQEWGPPCFQKFNGMWALALLDLSQHRLVLSRDRFGEKPLHVFKTEGGFFFASEIKGLLRAVENVRFSLNFPLAADFLTWGSVNHTNDTFFKGVESFPAASTAVIDLDNPTSWTAQKYWHLDHITENATLDFEEAQQQFKALFRSSVALRLRSDVPVGFCLSGGLDSSAIVCAAALENPHQAPQTFTTLSDVPRYNEKAWADIVNAHVQATAHFSLVQEDDFCADLDQVLWHQEEPFTTTSIYAQYRLMALAKQHKIPVMLDGQGADEALCGYRKFYLFYLRNLLKSHAYPLFLKESLAILRQGDRGLFRLKEGLKYLPSFLKKRGAPAQNILPPRFFESTLCFHETAPLHIKQIDDLLRLSVPALLRYEDRNAMAWSIESRVPFLDHRLVELLLSFPPSYKLRKGQTKAVLRKALVGLVPPQILNRKDKMGFATPQAEWMKNRLGKSILTHFKSPETRLQEAFDIKEIEKQMEKGQNSNLIFRLYILDKWMGVFNVAGPL